MSRFSGATWRRHNYSFAPLLADGSITADKIADDAITADKIADDAVTTSAIADDAVTTSAIVDDAVTSAKLADGVGGGGSSSASYISGTLNFGEVASASTFSFMNSGVLSLSGMTMIASSEVDVSAGDFFHFNAFPKAPIALYGSSPLAITSNLEFLDYTDATLTTRTSASIAVLLRTVFIPDDATDIRLMIGNTSLDSEDMSAITCSVNIASGVYTSVSGITGDYSLADARQYSTYFMAPADGKIGIAYKVISSQAGWDGNVFSSGTLKPVVPYTVLPALDPAPTAYSFVSGITVPVTAVRSDATTVTFTVSDWTGVNSLVEFVYIYLAPISVNISTGVKTHVSGQSPSTKFIANGSTTGVTTTVTSGVSYACYYVSQLDTAVFGVSSNNAFVEEIAVTVTDP